MRRLGDSLTLDIDRRIINTTVAGTTLLSSGVLASAFAIWAAGSSIATNVAVVGSTIAGLAMAWPVVLTLGVLVTLGSSAYLMNNLYNKKQPEMSKTHNPDPLVDSGTIAGSILASSGVGVSFFAIWLACSSTATNVAVVGSTIAGLAMAWPVALTLGVLITLGGSAYLMHNVYNRKQPESNNSARLIPGSKMNP